MIKKLVASLALVLILVTPLTTAYAAKDKIKIGWVFAMANAPILVAEKKGYFKEMGVEVEALTFSSGPLVHQALAAGELDMAYIGAPPVYHWFSRGLNSRILAKVNYGQAAVMVRKGEGIKTVADLKGKKLAGVRKGSGMDVLLRGYVLGEHAKLIPGKDIHVIPMKSGNMGPSLEQKVVDGAFIWEPFTSQFELRGNTEVIFDMNKAVPHYPWYIIMAMPEAMEKKKSGIIKVLKAHKKAVDFLNSSPTAGNDIIAKSFKLQDVTNAKTGKKYTGTEIVANARKRLGWAYELTDKDSAFMQRLMDYSLDLKYIKKKLKASDIIDKSFMNEALK